MKINKAAAVALLVALKFPKAGDWDEDKLIDRIKQVPSKFELSVVPEEHHKAYNQLVEADGDIQLVGGEKAEEVPDIDNMDLSALRILAEERKIKVKTSEMKSEPVLRAVIRKALKLGPRKSKVDKAVDAAAKKGKEAKPAKKAKDEEEGEEGEEEEEGGVEVDAFGSRVGSMRSKINLALTEDWQSADAVAEKAGVTMKQARSRLRRAARKGLVEVNRSVTYRLVAK